MSSFAVLWVRPGVGAWTQTISGQRVLLHVANMKRITPTPPPAGFRKGDILAGVQLGDVGTWFGETVDARLDAAAAEPSLISRRTHIALEKNGVATIYLQRRGSSDQAATVGYSTTDGTARAGVHYTASSGIVTFAPGEVAQTIDVPLIDNAAWSGNPSFRLSLSSSSGAALEGMTSFDIAIVDDDPEPMVTIGNVESPEGGAGPHEVQVPVTLSGATLLPVTLEWTATDELGSAPQRGQIVFAPGERAKSLTLAWSGDAAPNQDRRFTIVAGAENARVTAGSAIVVDDESVGVHAESLTVGEGAGDVLLPVTLSAPRTVAVTVGYSVSGGDDLQGAEGRLLFEPGVTTMHIPLHVVQDTTYEGTEEVEIRFFDASTGAAVRRPMITVAIVDDDPAPPLVITPISGPPHPEYSPIWFTLEGGPLGQRTIRTIGGSAEANRDFRPLDVQYRGGIVQLDLLNDSVAEDDETLTVQVIDSATAEVLGSLELVIADDDRGLPELTIDDVVVGEAGQTARFEIRLSMASATPVTFRADTVGATAAAGSDFTTIHTPVTLEPGQTSVTFEVPIIADGESEGQETFGVELWDLTGARLGKLRATAAIVDDDNTTPRGRRRSARH